MRIIILLVALFFMPGLALAQVTACTTDHRMLKRTLTNVHKEMLIWQGVDMRGNLIEIWMSKEGGWTRLMRWARGGQVCIVDTGENAVQFVWQPYAVKL